jgi:hypothetical protein
MNDSTKKSKLSWPDQAKLSWADHRTRYFWRVRSLVYIDIGIGAVLTLNVPETIELSVVTN